MEDGPIQAVLLAAGRGKRLRPLSDLLPKPAMPVLDVPVATFALRGLADVFEHVVVNTNHLPDAVVARLAPVAGPVRLEEFREAPEAYGTAGTLRALLPRLRPPVVVSNSDRVLHFSARALLRHHQEAGAAVTVLVEQVEGGPDFLLRDGRVTAFVDRRAGIATPGGRYLGVAVLGEEALGLLPDRRPAGLGESVLAATARSCRMAAVVHNGYTLDVGTPRDYLSANLDLLNGRTGPPPGASEPGRVVPVEGGLAYLGPRAEAGEDALGPGTILLRGARVEPGCRLERVVVWPGERMPKGTRVQDGIWALGRFVPAPL